MQPEQRLIKPKFTFLMKHVNNRTDEMSKAPVSFLATLPFSGLAEEEKSGNAKDMKTRQTCRYQDGDVPRTTTSDDREEERMKRR